LHLRSRAPRSTRRLAVRPISRLAPTDPRRERLPRHDRAARRRRSVRSNLDARSPKWLELQAGGIPAPPPEPQGASPMSRLPDPLDHRKPDHPIEPIFLKRWSPRAMTGEPVTAEELNRLFEAARW